MLLKLTCRALSAGYFLFWLSEALSNACHAISDIRQIGVRLKVLGHHGPVSPFLSSSSALGFVEDVFRFANTPLTGGALSYYGLNRAYSAGGKRVRTFAFRL